MDQELHQHLSSLPTQWSVVCQAIGSPAAAAAAASQELMQRYRKVVFRYLLGALRDEHAADDLTQEFALRFLRGELRGADPQRGRFRNFVKGVLFHMIADYHRRRAGHFVPMPAAGVEAVSAPEPASADQQFLESWREELLVRAWKSLESEQAQTGQPYYRVLRFRSEHLDLNSAEMAAQLTAELGKPVSGDWVRKILERARVRFADCLIADVLHTLARPTIDELEEELLTVGLMPYAQAAVERYRKVLSEMA